MGQLFKRMWRAARLDTNLYEEVEADESSLADAIKVVLISSIAAGISLIGHISPAGMFRLVLGSLALWYAWAFITYLIGGKLLPGPKTKTDFGELLRTIGFSSAPGVFRLLGIIPPLREIVFPVVDIWMFMAMVVAVRQALDYTQTWRAIVVCFVGWVIYFVGLALTLSFLMNGQ